MLSEPVTLVERVLANLEKGFIVNQTDKTCQPSDLGCDGTVPRLHQLIHIALSIFFLGEPNFRLCAAAEEAFNSLLEVF